VSRRFARLFLGVAVVVGTGAFIVIGSTPAGPLYLELITPNPDFPAFQHCRRLTG
jgi:hypothetical protein